MHRRARRPFHRLQKRTLRVLQRHPVLRSFRSRHRRFHASQIQLQLVRELRVRRLVRAEKPLLLAVRFHQRDLLRRPGRELQIRQRLRIHREKSHRRPVFRSHVRNHRAVRHAQAREPRPVELHEFPHHAFLSQHLRDVQY